MTPAAVPTRAATPTEGDGTGSFDAWYRATYRTLLAVALADGAAVTTAEDAAATAATAVLARWGQLRNPAAYAITVTRNELRRAGRRRDQPDGTTIPDRDGGGDPRAILEFFERVAPLPDRQRHAVTLRHVLDLTEHDIAAALGVRRGTVSVLLRRAYTRLAALDAVHGDPVPDVR